MAETVPVYLRCPSCGHQWHAATLIEGAWWYAPPETAASQCYCVACGQKPPMAVVGAETQGTLFAAITD